MQNAGVLGVDPASQVCVGAELLHRRLQLGDSVLRMQALANNAVQGGLVFLDPADNPLLEYVLRLLHVETMQVDVVVVGVPVVFDEDKLGRLSVEAFRNRQLLFGLCRQFTGPLFVAGLVGLLGLFGKLGPLRVRKLRLLPEVHVLFVGHVVVILLAVCVTFLPFARECVCRC